MNDNKMQPVKNRIVALDALRGFALLGIAMANFPEFSLWTFLDGEAQRGMASGGLDTIVRSLQYMLIDGKFYTIFSVLFGIGFYIIISHAMQRGANGFRFFLRRMLWLLAIGVAHLMLLWSGDILALYAAIGLLLPLFRNCEPKTLLRWSAVFFSLPIIIEIWRTLSGIDTSALLYNAWWSVANSYGITEENFAAWLRDANGYGDVHAFLMQGAVERMCEFVSGQRYFKVLALFLLGYYIGRQKIFANLDSNVGLFSKVAKIGFAIGVPLSAVYTWSAMQGQPWGAIFHSAISTQGRRNLEGSRLPRTYGVVVLHNAICDWDFTVLRHRIWVRHERWTYNDRSNCGGSVWRRGGVLRDLAEVVQLRRVGMDLADADVWEVDEVAERVITPHHSQPRTTFLRRYVFCTNKL